MHVLPDHTDEKGSERRGKKRKRPNRRTRRGGKRFPSRQGGGGEACASPSGGVSLGDPADGDVLWQILGESPAAAGAADGEAPSSGLDHDSTSPASESRPRADPAGAAVVRSPALLPHLSASLC